MKILYIDMDGTVADFDHYVQPLIPDIELGDGDPSTYAERSKRVDEVMIAHPNMFEKLPLMPRAYESVCELRDSGLYDIYFLSTPVCHVPESYSGKRIWLRDTFGEWVDKRLILTHRKDLVIGDYLIDDRMKNGAENFQGKHIHFGSKQFPNWQSVINLLLYE